MSAWRLRDDVVSFECLRLRLHRIGRSHWRADGILRSWGAVPLHREGDTLHAPCADGEALWLGAWLDEDDTVNASVRLTDPASGRTAGIAPPATFQIARLTGPDGTRHALVRADARLQMTLRCGPASADLSLLLQAPVSWAELSGRPAPDALTGPPPLAPRLG